MFFFLFTCNIRIETCYNDVFCWVESICSYLCIHIMTENVHFFCFHYNSFWASTSKLGSNSLLRTFLANTTWVTISRFKYIFPRFFRTIVAGLSTVQKVSDSVHLRNWKKDCSMCITLPCKTEKGSSQFLFDNDSLNLSIFQIFLPKAVVLQLCSRDTLLRLCFDLLVQKGL